MLKLLLAVCILCGLMAAGCSTHYYRVTDPGSGRTYYTNKFERVWQGGAVNFEDAQSGISVTLQSSRGQRALRRRIHGNTRGQSGFEADC